MEVVGVRQPIDELLCNYLGIVVVIVVGNKGIVVVIVVGTVVVALRDGVGAEVLMSVV